MTVEELRHESRTCTRTWVLVFVFVCGVRIADYLYPEVRNWILILGLICLLVRDRSVESDDSLLIFGTIAVGLLPIAGWVPGLTRICDPILILSALSIARATLVVRIAPSIQWFLLPVAVANYWGIHRWWRFTSGSPSEILSRLFSGWDHFGHFYLFLNSIRFNSFVAKAPEIIAEKTAYGRRYPAGIQMSWSQWWPQDRNIAMDNPSELLRHYTIVVIVTAAISSVLLSTALVRVFKPKSRIIVASAVSLGVCLLVFAGPLSITIWNGFPNFFVAITGVAVVVSLCYQPLKSRVAHMTTLFAAISLTTYNWHPLLIAVAPLVAVSLWQQITNLDVKNRIWFICGSSALGILTVIPVIGTLQFGVKHLTIDGGIIPLPPNIVVLVTGLSVAIGLIHLCHGTEDWRIQLASPLLVAPLLFLTVATYVRISHDAYSYYVQKVAMGVVFICIAALLIIKRNSIDQLIDAFESRGRIWSAPGFVVLLLFAFSVSQMFGYIGPDWKNLAPTSSSVGLYANQTIDSQIAARQRTSNLLISLSSAILDEETQRQDCFVLDDIDMQDYDPVLTNYWVGVLTWTLTEEQLTRAQSFIPLKTGIPDVAKNAEVVASLLSPDRDCPIVSENLARHLVLMNARWAGRLWIILSDGRVVKFRG